MDRSLLLRFPNEAELFVRAAAVLEEDADALYREALALDPANAEALCYFADQSQQAMMNLWLPDGCEER